MTRFECTTRTKIAYEDRGSGNALLFIHGHPFNRSMWAPQILAFSSTHRVIAPDLRGYGESSSEDLDHPTTLEVFAEDIRGLLDNLKVSRVVVVGLSMGGQIAMEFVRANQNMAAGVVLAATFAEPETLEGVRTREEMANRLLREGMAGPGLEMMPKFLALESMRRLPEVAARVYTMIANTSPRAAASALRGRALRRDYRPIIEKITVPTLVISGTEDAFTSIEEARAMAARVPGAGLSVLPACGHLPNLEYADAFNDALREFLLSSGF